VGSVIWDAFLGSIVKGATAPFNVLGSVFGGGREMDLSELAFESGSGDFTDDSTAKMDVLGTALTERPALRLEITGHFSRDVDEPVLRNEALENTLLARAREKDSSIEVLTGSQRRSVIREWFETEFPERVPDPVPVPPGRPDQQGVPVEDMVAALLETIDVPDERFMELATARAERVKATLIGEHTIAEARLRLAPPTEVEIEAPSGNAEADDFEPALVTLDLGGE